jgi:hypothetical protein
MSLDDVTLHTSDIGAPAPDADAEREDLPRAGGGAAM